METILREAYPAPRMVLVSSTAEVQYFITAEGEVLGEYPSFQDTLFFMFASYYVYHLKYPSHISNRDGRGTFSAASYLTRDRPTMSDKVPVCTRELLWYVSNDSTTFYHDYYHPLSQE